ncbi:DegV family protein [Acidaminobacter sp. JC074]|uniref:DegV family protein n=1 Tax=Acidaminobacter sp. JC074 TaxID=2530199 RepID=UPI001F0D75BD|nr:DegV family protein [Acidaminobacter sp. JC074]MCH4890028.1 DegV family protein [Acidaminobacter sp. JC074]
MPVKLITDSGCDLPKSVTIRYDIEVIPLKVFVDEVEYLDSESIESHQMMLAIDKGVEVKTGQITPNTYEAVFNRYLDQGYDVLYLSFSSDLSSSYQSACLAKKNLEGKGRVEVLDTRCASLGQGLLVLDAAKSLKHIDSIDALVDYVKSRIGDVNHHYVVSDLKYLFKGGRLSSTQYQVGKLIKMNLILGLEDGKLLLKDKKRGKKKSYQKLLSNLSGKDLSNVTVGINYGLNTDDAEYIRSEVEALKPKEIIMHPIGCAIGAHTGPDYVGLFFQEKS